MPARKKNESLCQRIQELINQLQRRKSHADQEPESNRQTPSAAGGKPNPKAPHPGQATGAEIPAGPERSRQMADQIGQSPAGDAAQVESEKLSVDSLNLGTDENRVIVSLESFFRLNFEISRGLDRLVERKILDAHQREWNEWADPSLDRQTECRNQAAQTQRWDEVDGNLQSGQAESLNPTYRNRPK